MAKVYSIVMNKGGVGKTTAIANLAAALHIQEPDAKILMIDSDGQGNLSLSFGVNIQTVEHTIYDVFVGKRMLDDIKIDLDENLHIVPANEDMNTIDFAILTNLDLYPRPLFILKEAIQNMDEQYDYIFIDTPPSLGLVTGNALAASNKVVVPFQPELFGVQGLINVLFTVEQFAEKNNPELSVAAVFGSMVDNRTGLHGEMMQQARRYCATNDIYMAETVITRTIKYANAVARKEKPAVYTDKSNPYFDLLKEVL
ncbi:ParA family protein [Aneurinibacillus thermoaerophilus]|uniref:ParA family protein n=1 Tax=Aneurinibacillus thermoaerophilus TaxID=143495 RepID=UPI002E24C616|nr:ParA family protein [Aneurinibacillus thermoaerophilus]